MMLIDIIAGARPNFVKIASIINAIHNAENKLIKYRLIHTGQHYDEKMSGTFFNQLGIPQADHNLDVGSGTQAEQTAKIMLGYEKILNVKKAALCLVVGDVNSTMACALVASKLQVPIAHVEAGIRSGDLTMPEEINRIVTDAITSWYFTTTKNAKNNLIKNGVESNKIFFVGNTMIDTLRRNMNRLSPPDFWNRFSLVKNSYIVVTLHRPSNVDCEKKLNDILNEIEVSANNFPIIFPVHPRTNERLKRNKNKFSAIHFVDPMGYLEFNYLVKNAMCVITDSGGVTEETTVMGVPCLTLRSNTERPETVEIGTNELLGTDPKYIAPAVKRVISGNFKKGKIPEKWDGKAGERIVNIITEKIFSK